MTRYKSFDQLLSEPTLPFRHVASCESLVISRQLLLRVALSLIVVNPQLRMFPAHNCRYLVHGLERSVLAPIIVGDIAMIETCLEVRGIAAKNYRSSFRQPHKQRLVSGGMSGCGKKHQAAIAKDIVVTVDE